MQYLTGKPGELTINYTGAGNNTPKDNVTTVIYTQPDTPDSRLPHVQDDDELTPVKPEKPPKKEIPNKQNETKTLPQTGEKDREVAGVDDRLITGLVLIGLTGVKKRKKEEE